MGCNFASMAEHLGSHTMEPIGCTMGLTSPGRTYAQPSDSQLSSCGSSDKESYSPLLKEFPAVPLPQVGEFPDFGHTIQLQQDTVPVACKDRPIPLALCSKVETAVRETDAQGVWEPMDKSE